MLKTTGKFPGSLTIYKRLSTATRFVHGLGTVLDVDNDSRWRNKLRSITKDAN